MKEYLKYIINEHLTVIEALKMINDIPQEKTLFVINDEKQVIGTLTDGDIRRGLIAGMKVNDPINTCMNFSFYYINNEKIDIQKIKELKESKNIKLICSLNDGNQVVKLYPLNELNSILPMHALIMAGGEGKRLLPLTEKIPKPMIRIAEKPIIEYNIDNLISYGVEEFYISINYKGEQIKSYFGDGSKKGISIKYINETTPLGTIGALSLIDNLNAEHLLVVNADLFTNIDYENLFIEYQKCNASLAVATIPYTVNIPYAILKHDGNRVTALQEKPVNTYYANAGIYLIRKTIYNQIPTSQFYNATDLIGDLIKQNRKVIHNPIIGYWIDIGNPDDLNKAKEFAKHLNN